MEPVHQAANPQEPATVARAVKRTIFWGAFVGGITHLGVKICKLSPIFTIVNTIQIVAQTAFKEAADLVSEKYSIPKYKIEIAKAIASVVISTIATAVLFGCSVTSPPIAAMTFVGGFFLFGVEIYAALNTSPNLLAPDAA